MVTTKDAKPHDEKVHAPDGAAAAPAAKGRAPFQLFSTKSPIIAGILALVLVVGAALFVFRREQPAADSEQTLSLGGAGQPVFYDIPDILVNMASSGEKPAFLKLSVSLELDDMRARAAIAPVVPRVVDQLQTYLRELRIEDLSGSAAVFRLKEEMLRRVNLATEPVQVKDVLFREMIVQ